MEEVLSWDDGAYSDSSDIFTAPTLELSAAVMFQAPEWATHVVGVHYYIMDDSMMNPSGPDLPSTSAFEAHVWVPEIAAHTHPGESATGGIDSGELYPEDAWLELRLPEAVNIEDSVVFPERLFFIGIKWLHRYNPQIGYDDSAPVDGYSWAYDGVSWAPLPEFDLMVRAVVSDGSASPASMSTWSVIKAGFR